MTSAKPYCHDKRPDVIFHKRGIKALNFVVVEIKRQRTSTSDQRQYDIDKIQNFWFGERLHYVFGASLILDEDEQTFEAAIFENAASDTKLEISTRDTNYLLNRPSASEEARKRIGSIVESIRANEADLRSNSTLLTALHDTILAVFHER